MNAGLDPEPGGLPRVLIDVYQRMLVSLDCRRRTASARPCTRRSPTGNYALFDDVLPALASLASRVSRGDRVELRSVAGGPLGAPGDPDEFPVRVISGLEGMEKPDLEIYALALERLGLPADQVAFVGDNPEFDIVPPMALGMS